MSRAEKTIVRGAAVMTASTLVVKVIGALFKIPLANILGGVGMSYFVSAYDVFSPLYTMSVSGLCIATSKMTAETVASGNGLKNSVLAVSKRLFLLIGILFSGLLLFLSGVLSRALGNEGARLALIAIAPGLLFSCLSAAYRGYFQGQSRMTPTAKSQIIEAVVKLLFGVTLSFFVFRCLDARYVMGTAPAWLMALSPHEARLVILQLAAAGAVFGVTLSTLAGLIYMKVVFRREEGGMPRRKRLSVPKNLARTLVATALPIAATSAVANLTTLIDLGSVMNCLRRAVEREPQAFLSQYENLLPPEVTLSVIPEYLYGCYSGLAMSLMNLAPALTAGIGISAIPVISSHFTRREGEELAGSFQSVLRTTAFVACPIGAGIAAMPYEILRFLYPEKLMEVTIVAPLLRVMGISSVLIAFSAVMNNLLQAVGKEKVPLKALLLGGLLKLTVNFLLVSNPRYNIGGVVLGTLSCYFLITLICTRQLFKAGFRVRDLKVVLPPVLGAAFAGWGARKTFTSIGNHFQFIPAFFLSAAVGGLLYFAFIFLTGLHGKRRNSF